MIDDKLIKKIIREATSEKSSRGSYVSPLLPGYREFQKNQNAPFTEFVTQWDDAMLDHDSIDGKMSTKKSEIKKREKRAEKIARYIKNNPDSFTFADDGGVMNGIPGKNLDAKPLKNFDPKKTVTKLSEWVEIKKNTVASDFFKKIIKEADTSVTAGEFNGPFSIGLKKWPNTTLAPFEYEFDYSVNHHSKKSHLKNNKKSNTYYKGPEFFKKLKDETYPTHTIKEDLAVWFGKKKKLKGSSQPKGPWVDICRKVDGKHPPCGRKDADSGSYPKCRAAGVAGKMSDSQKRSACQQKRKAEKNDSQSGKGQKPVMTSYKTKKESVDSIVFNILSEFRNSI